MAIDFSTHTLKFLEKWLKVNTTDVDSQSDNALAKNKVYEYEMKM